MVARDHAGDHGLVTALRFLKSRRCFLNRELRHGLNSLVPDLSRARRLEFQIDVYGVTQACGLLPVARHPGAMRGPNRKLKYTSRLIVTDARSSSRAVQGKCALPSISRELGPAVGTRFFCPFRSRKPATRISPFKQLTRTPCKHVV